MIESRAERYPFDCGGNPRRRDYVSDLRHKCKKPSSRMASCS